MIATVETRPQTSTSFKKATRPLLLPPLHHQDERDDHETLHGLLLLARTRKIRTAVQDCCSSTPIGLGRTLSSRSPAGCKSIAFGEESRYTKVYPRMKSARKWSSKGARKERKKVSFNNNVKALVQNTREPTRAQPFSDRWYTSEEYEQIKKRNRIVVLKLMGHPLVRDVKLVNECSRGLHCLLPETQKHRMQRRQKIVSLVKKFSVAKNESERGVLIVHRKSTGIKFQLNFDHPDRDELMARWYSSLSTSAVTAARYEAQRDALVAADHQMNEYS